MRVGGKKYERNDHRGPVAGGCGTYHVLQAMPNPDQTEPMPTSSFTDTPWILLVSFSDQITDDSRSYNIWSDAI